MSRSYRKVGGWTDHGRYTWWWKRHANKKVRKAQSIDSGSAYKKIGNSYDICDYKFLYFSDAEIDRMEIEQRRCWLCRGRGTRAWIEDDLPERLEIGRDRYKYWMK